MTEEQARVMANWLALFGIPAEVERNSAGAWGVSVWYENRQRFVWETPLPRLWTAGASEKFVTGLPDD